MMITAKANEMYREIELYQDNVKIGEAEVDLMNHTLSKLMIFEPYQNQGFGTEVVRMLVQTYELDKLWVRADNSHAIHVYKKCGFSISKPTMFEMVRELREE